MRISFFSESPFRGKVPRNHPNMRTELSWMSALNADHYPIIELGTVYQQYDLGIIIIPKKGIENIYQDDIPSLMRKCCKKIAFMQEGPVNYFEDHPVHHQIWFYNILVEMDYLFFHNACDCNYLNGLIEKDCFWMPSLMIEDSIKSTNIEQENRTIIGGNFVSWYGGFPSYIVASEFFNPIDVPTMGRKQQNEEQLDNLNHLPYMNWVNWVNNLKRYKYAVHLMPTFAAGTFALNCSYYGIPCIGYRNLETQSTLFPDLSVDLYDVNSAKQLARKLMVDNDFYKECSEKSKQMYEQEFSERVFLQRFKNYKKEIFK